MDRATALKQLPAVYASALQLREQGVDDNGVAEHLGIPAESIPALFRIAEAKLVEISEPLVEISGPLGGPVGGPLGGPLDKDFEGVKSTGSGPRSRDGDGQVP